MIQRIALSARVRSMLLNARSAYAHASIDGGAKGLDFRIDLHSDLLEAHIDGSGAYDNGTLRYEAEADLAEAKLGLLLDNPDLGSATARLESSARFRPTTLKSRLKSNPWRMIDKAEAKIDIERLEYRGYAYAGINITAQVDAEGAKASVTSTDPNARLGL